MTPTSIPWKAILSAVDVTSLKISGYGPFHVLANMTELEGVGEEEMLAHVQAIKSEGFNLNLRRLEKGTHQLIHGYIRGTTALQIAARRRMVGLVRALVRAGADVNISCALDWSTLSYAAEGGHPVIVRFLTESGADISHSFALHEAARVCAPGSVETTQILLDAGADANEQGMKMRRTPAQICCTNTGGGTAERAAVLLTLLKGGADLDVVDGHGHTLMHLAAQNGLYECINVLAEQGLAVDTRSSPAFSSPLHLVAGSQNTASGGQGGPKSVQALLRHGADVDQVDVRGESPLFDAVRKANADTAEALIDAGASVTVKEGRNDITALHIAAAVGNIKLAYLLIETGADICALTKDGCSPLKACAVCDRNLMRMFEVRASSKTQRQQVAKLLLRLGAPLDEKFLSTAMATGWADFIAEAYVKANEKAAKAIGRLGMVARHISSPDLSDVAFSGRVVKVKLINEEQQEAEDDEHATEYILSLSLTEKLIPQALSADTGEEGAEVSTRQMTGAGGVQTNIAMGSLLRLLDPESAGFQGNDVGGGVRTAGGFGGREIELRHDGSDFTKEGFGAVVAFITTGSVEDFLTRERRVSGSGRRSDGTTQADSSAEGGEGGGGKRLRLFDVGLAEAALQAAEFFCLGEMRKEVENVAIEYGFEMGGTRDGDEDGGMGDDG